MLHLEELGQGWGGGAKMARAKEGHAQSRSGKSKAEPRASVEHAARSRQRAPHLAMSWYSCLALYK